MTNRILLPKLVIGAWSLGFLLAGVCHADEPPPFADPADESAQYNVETLLSGLDNPYGLALRPGAPAQGPFEVFMSESGAGRILRLSTDKPQDTAPVVTGFPLSNFGHDPAVRVGPLGLEFLTPNRLVIGTGGLETGKELVQVYALPDDLAPLTYDQTDHSAGPVPPGPRTETGEGDFLSITKTEIGVFVAAGAGDKRGWVLRAVLDANRLADLQPFIPTVEVAGVGHPRAVVINPKINYHYLVVGEAGEPTDARDSRISMYGSVSGALAMNLNAGLRDVASIAYSPTGDMYAADYSTARPDEGGVFRIEAATVDGRESIRPVKIASVVRPTALLFTPDGALYVTAIGDRASADAAPAGVLVRITPSPNAPKL